MSGWHVAALIVGILLGCAGAFSAFVEVMFGGGIYGGRGPTPWETMGTLVIFGVPALTLIVWSFT